MTQKIDIRWSPAPSPLWLETWRHLPTPTVLQDPCYARAMAIMNRQQARFGLITRDGQPLGTVTILEARALGGLLHAVILDRGPCWLTGAGGIQDWKDFCAAWDQYAPLRPLRKRRTMLEMPDSPSALALLTATKWPKITQMPAYQTLMLSLAGDVESWRARLRPDFRQRLNKADCAGLTLSWDTVGTTLPWLLQAYQADKAEKGYQGPRVETILGLCAAFGPAGQLRIARVLKDGVPVAAGLFFLHGRGATYQIGVVLKDGRAACANHFLMWHALAYLRDAEIDNLDLGGVNDEDTMAGVTAFKQALGSRFLRLVPVYG
ncbi:MAG: GNAT family N-acetyltransferase [Pseudomonadota bacterium]